MKRSFKMTGISRSAFISFLYTSVTFLVFMPLTGCCWLGDHVPITDQYGSETFSTEISVVSWNAGKGTHEKSPGDTAHILSTLIQEYNIVCIQEFVTALIDKTSAAASKSQLAGGEFGRSFNWFFSPPSGVATFSRVCPIPGSILPKNSWWNEGWFLTPKMTLMTKYRMSNQVLLVANVHGLNFQPISKYMFEEQLTWLHRAIKAHSGPVIVCGDFNTWRQDRMDMVEEYLEGLTPVPFDSGTRTSAGWLANLFFGDGSLPIDHIFIRGLVMVRSGVFPSTASDHKPLTATLRLIQDAESIKKTAIIDRGTPPAMGNHLGMEP